MNVPFLRFLVFFSSRFKPTNHVFDLDEMNSNTFIVLPLAVFSSIGFFVSICLRSPIKQINQLKFTKKTFLYSCSKNKFKELFV